MAPDPSALRFARHYLDLLEAITQVYSDGGAAGEAAIAAFERDADNIWQAEHLVLTRGADDPEWAALATHYAGTGAALFLRHLDLEPALAWIEGYLAIPAVAARDEIGAMLFALRGIVLGDLGRYDAAQASHEQSIALARRADDAERVASGLGHLGVIYSMRRDFAAAEQCYVEQEGLARLLEDEHQLARVLGNRAILCADLGDAPGAMRYASAAVRLFGKLGSEDGQSRALLTLGSALEEMSQYQLAETAIAQSLAICLRARDRHGELAGLSALGRLREHQNANEDAERLYGQALDLARAIGDPMGEDAVLQHLAHLLVDKGAYRPALRLLRAKLGRALARGDRWAVATTHESLGTAYRDAGYTASAIRHLSRAARGWARVGNAVAESVALSHLGVAYARAEDDETAMACFDESARIGRGAQSPQREARGLANGALCRWKVGDEAEAIRRMERAVAVATPLEPDLADEYRRHLARWNAA